MTDIFEDLQTLLISTQPQYAAFLMKRHVVFTQLDGIALARARSVFRLVQALHGFAEDNAGTMDIAVLFRQVIRAYQRRLRISIRLWMQIEQRCQYVSVRQADLEQDGLIELQADPWETDWLAHTESIDTLAVRRSDHTVIGDGMLYAMTTWSRYRSQAQKAAVSAGLFAMPGSTTLITLPTGSGKSLCSLLPIWSATKGGQIKAGTTIVIVPTVSLALDQERQARSFFAHSVNEEYTPHSFTGSTSSDVRITIERGIRYGTMPIVFVSPEAILGSLAEPCLEAAQRGTLHSLIIDEAHLVETWGAGFRTEFQLLSGFRRELMKASNGQLRTVLLSATISSKAEDVLKTLFAEASTEHWIRIQADQLRPEIGYWLNIADTAEQRETQVIDALAHLPRPAILYLTEPEDAEAWYEKLITHGFKRLATYTGKTDAAERERLIHEWMDDKRDLMIATSAFGLGIDKPDVRTILHACLPDSIARFYQEVGRAGRDGCSAISLTCLLAQKDYQRAKGMLSTARITTDRAFERWQGMQKGPQSIQYQGDDLVLNLDATPLAEQHLRRSPMNRNWNEHVLLLMKRAGIIDLLAIPKYAESDTQTQTQATHRLQVKVLQHHAVNDEATFAKTVGPWRNDERFGLEHDLSRLLNLIEQATRGLSQCIAQSLSEAYPDASLACGGCPSCRQHMFMSYAKPSRLSFTWEHIPQPNLESTSALAILIEQSPTVLVVSTEAQWIDARETHAFLAKLVVQGFRQLIVPDNLLEGPSGSALLTSLARNPDHQHLLIPSSWVTGAHDYPILPIPSIILYPSENMLADRLYQHLKPLFRNIPVLHLIHASLYLQSEHGFFKDRVNGITHSFESLEQLMTPFNSFDDFNLY